MKHSCTTVGENGGDDGVYGFLWKSGNSGMRIFWIKGIPLEIELYGREPSVGKSSLIFFS